MGLLALLAVAACLALAPNAVAAVYWGNFGTNAIGGSELDGSLASQAFIPAQGPGGVAVDGQHIYWTNFGGTTIGRANLDGSAANQSFITTDGPAFGVAVDGQHVYWANNTNGTIGRANLDGSAVANDFITGAVDPEGVAVDGQHIYWGNYSANTIGRANLDGSGAQQAFVTGAAGPTGVAVDGAHIYWSSTNNNSIGRVNLDGSSGKDLNFIPDPIALNTEGVAVFGGFIYFTTGNNPGSPGTIGRANVDGSNPNSNFITTAAPWPFGIAVDGTSFNRRPVPGGTPGGTRPTGRKRLKFGKVKLDKKKGTALLPVTVPSSGKLSLAGKGVRVSKKVPRAGTYKLGVKAKGKAKSKLFSTGKVKVKVVVAFKPRAGATIRQTKTIQLKRN